MRGLALGVVVCSWCALALAEPLPVKHVAAVRVSVANKSQHALGLRALPAGAGWRLELAASDGDSADVIDVTPGTPARTLTIAVVGRTLTFDALRFAGGHVYRVQLRGDKRGASWSFVYLYPDAAALKLPPPKAGAAERVRFEADDDNARDDGAPARTEKGAL